MKDEVARTVYHFKTHPEGDIKIRSICLFGEEIQTLKSIIPRTNGQQKYLSSGLPVARYSQLLVSFGLCGNHTSIRVARHGLMAKSEKLLKMLENRISLAMFFQDRFALFEFPWNKHPIGVKTSHHFQQRQTPVRSFQTRMFVSSEPERTNLPSGV